METGGRYTLKTACCPKSGDSQNSRNEMSSGLQHVKTGNIRICLANSPFATLDNWASILVSNVTKIVTIAKFGHVVPFVFTLFVYLINICTCSSTLVNAHEIYEHPAVFVPQFPGGNTYKSQVCLAGTSALVMPSLKPIT